MKKLLLIVSFIVLAFAGIKAANKTAINQVILEQNLDNCMLESTKKPLKQKTFLDLFLKKIKKPIMLVITLFSLHQTGKLWDIAKAMKNTNGYLDRVDLLQSFYTNIDWAILAQCALLSHFTLGIIDDLLRLCFTTKP